MYSQNDAYTLLFPQPKCTDLLQAGPQVCKETMIEHIRKCIVSFSIALVRPFSLGHFLHLNTSVHITYLPSCKL